VAETPAKRFDLVMGVNVRAALLACRAALPHLIATKGHVINMSPPLDLSIVPGRVAYAVSKLGMTLLTLGLAEEVRAQGVSVNSLWPVTIIESQASINHGLGTPADWRKPDILVDCVRRIVAKGPGELTGKALLDEELLRAEGVTDFGGYACVPGSVPRRLTWKA
jgi:citronellol/citronellal dehydrogenase